MSEGESVRCLWRRECEVSVKERVREECEVSVKERVRGVCEGESARCL